MKESIAIPAPSVPVTDLSSVSWLWLLAVIVLSVRYLPTFRENFWLRIFYPGYG